MNHQRCTSHDDSLQPPFRHGSLDEMLCMHPSDVGIISILLRSEEEELHSSEEKQLALQHYGGRCTENNDDLRSSMEKKSVLMRNYAGDRSSSRHEYLSQHSQHLSDRMTQMLSDANLAAYQVENTNTARFGRCDCSNEERYANLAVGTIMSQSEHRASTRDQDMYSSMNRTDQHHHTFNVSGWQQSSKSSTCGKDEGHYSGGSDSYSRKKIDKREQDLHSTMSPTDQHHQYTNVSGGQQTPKSSVDGYIRRTIEISPGVHVRLRGAEETWDSIGRDFFMPCLCFCCSHELCCIQDADYVLCPKCRVVSPMDTTSYGSESANATAASASASTAGIEHEGGVGLGFTFADLLKWQAEIIQGRDFLSGNGL
jgi:hypothetical protein